MAEVDLEIGGRSFKIVCADGEEPSLHKAAALLDAEASLVTGQLGRLSEARLLLMAGLMLADRAVSMQTREKELDQKITELTAEVERAKNEPSFGVKKVEVPVYPKGVPEMLEKAAVRAEELAELVESQSTADVSEEKA